MSNGKPELRVVCYPDIPDQNDPIMRQMLAVAAREGKTLILTKYQKPIQSFTRTWMIIDEYSDLHWATRKVIRRRGKVLIYHHDPFRREYERQKQTSALPQGRSAS